MTRPVTVPIVMRWTGEEFIPLDRFKRQCAELYTIDTLYSMEISQPRSQASHNEYFALLHRAWENLPPPYDLEFPDVQTLRAFALIKTGFCTIEKLPCGTNEKAVQTLRFMPAPKDYCITEIQGSVLTRYTPRSQSYRAMGKKMFQESKEAVLTYVSTLIGIDVRELRSAPRAA